MKVIATRMGYYQLKRRRENDVFFLKKESDFRPSWMKVIGDQPLVEKPEVLNEENAHQVASSDDEVI